MYVSKEKDTLTRHCHEYGLVYVRFSFRPFQYHPVLLVELAQTRVIIGDEKPTCRD
jgi:hypothetical protein